MKEDIKSMTLPELTTWMSALGEKGFRAKQLYNWMHKNLVSSFDEMTNLSGALKSKLKEQADFVVLTPVDVRISSIDGTRKYLFRLQDGNVIESVLMRYRFGNSVAFPHKSAAVWAVVFVLLHLMDWSEAFAQVRC